MAIPKGIRIHQYLDDWLVRARSHQACLQHTQDLTQKCVRNWLAGEFGKVRTGAQAGFRFCRLPVRPQVRSVPTDTGPVAESLRENTETAIPTGLSCLAIHVLDRFINSHRKASSSRPTSYETHTVAFEKQLEGTGITRKVIPIARSLHPHLQWWLEEDNVLTGPPFHPIKHALQIFTDTSKEGLGAHCKRNLVPSRKQAAHKLSGTKSSLFSLKRVPRALLRQDSTCSN